MSTQSLPSHFSTQSSTIIPPSSANPELTAKARVSLCNVEIKSYAAEEEKILQLWEGLDAFRESLRRSEGKPTFTFYDGPPFATGTPHYGHILAGTIKDVVTRYAAMTGRHVERRFGWDCHGLPIEFEIEKTLGIKSKEDVEALGIRAYNQACRDIVMRFAGTWRDVVTRMGRWIDFDRDYKTLNAPFMESSWWVFSKLWEQGRVYRGCKVMPYSTGCTTALSNHEANMNYQDVSDPSLFVVFSMKKPSEALERVLNSTNCGPFNVPSDPAEAAEMGAPAAADWGAVGFVAWTTTPWTLPSNLALVVHPAFRYAVLRVNEPVPVKQTPRPKFVIVEVSRVEQLLQPYSAVTKTAKKEEGGATAVASGGAASTRNKDKHAAAAGTEAAVPEIQVGESNGPFTCVATLSGAEVAGSLYYPLFPYFESMARNFGESTGAFTVLADEYVTRTTGTGLVHSAPAFGEDDYRVSVAGGIVTARNLDKVCPLDANGRFTKDVPDFVGHYVKDADGPISLHLKMANKLWYKTSIKHSYPFCWRSETPLIYRAVESWFIDVQVVKEELKSCALETHWVPKYIENRFINTLDDAPDWTISRTRYWGTPLPIWTDPENAVFFIANSASSLGKRAAVIINPQDACYEDGSALSEETSKDVMRLAEAAAESPVKLQSSSVACLLPTADGKMVKITCAPVVPESVVDLHRENVDFLLAFPEEGNAANSKMLRRVPFVFDCWFESGAMPYGQAHYPFENVEAFERSFPADFIAEGVDQCRGWFYTLLVLSVALFGKPAFRNLIVNGLVLAEDGKKMSKRLQNYPDPMSVVSGNGADALRLLLINSPVVRGMSVRFKEASVREVVRDVIIPLSNSVKFFTIMYRDVEGIRGADLSDPLLPPSFDLENKWKESTNVMDLWILSARTTLLRHVHAEMSAYRLYTVVPGILQFLEHLTNWYIRMNRNRFKDHQNDLNDAHIALSVLNRVLLAVSVTLAPFTPFIVEKMYQILRPTMSTTSPLYHDSVHFCQLQEVEVGDKPVSPEIERRMTRFMAVINLARGLREAAPSVSLRKPLRSVLIIHPSEEYVNDLRILKSYVESELNCVDAFFSSNVRSLVELKAAPVLSSLGPRFRGDKKTMGAVTSGIKELNTDKIFDLLYADGSALASPLVPTPAADLDLADESHAAQDSTSVETGSSVTIAGETLVVGKDISVSREFRVASATDGSLDLNLAPDAPQPVFQSGSDGNVVVVVDKAQDDTMFKMFLAREFTNALQQLRKASGLIQTEFLHAWYDLSGEECDCSQLHESVTHHLEPIEKTVRVTLRSTAECVVFFFILLMFSSIFLIHILFLVGLTRQFVTFGRGRRQDYSFYLECLRQFSSFPTVIILMTHSTFRCSCCNVPLPTFT